MRQGEEEEVDGVEERGQRGMEGGGERGMKGWMREGCAELWRGRSGRSFGGGCGEQEVMRNDGVVELGTGEDQVGSRVGVVRFSRVWVRIRLGGLLGNR